MFRKLFYISTTILVAFGLCFAQNPITPAQQQAFDEVCNGIKMFPVWKVGSNRITIDGKVNEVQWDTAQKIFITGEWPFFVDYLTQPDAWAGWGDVVGIVRALYDDENLYLSVYSYDDVHYGGEDDNTEPWYRVDGIEVFIQPAGHDVSMLLKDGSNCNIVPEHNYFISIKTRFNNANKVVYRGGENNCKRCPLDVLVWDPGCEDDAALQGIRCVFAAETNDTILSRYDGAWCMECIFPFAHTAFSGAFSKKGYTNPPTGGPSSILKMEVDLNDDDNSALDVEASQFLLRRYCEWWGSTDCHLYEHWSNPHFYPTWAYAGERTAANEAAMASVKPDYNNYYLLPDTITDWEDCFMKAIETGINPCKKVGVLPYGGMKKSANIKAMNVPNPFKPSTEIYYKVRGVNAEFSVMIYDMHGNVVRDLKADSKAGSVKWDGLDDKGNMAPSGIYVYRIKSGDQAYASRMVLAR